MSKISGKTETIENVESATFDPSKASEHVRAVAAHVVEQSKEGHSELRSGAETTLRALESSFEIVKTSGNEVSLNAVAILRANTEAYFTHLEALATVKSLSEFVELQTAFVRKQMEQSVEQAKNFQATAMRATEGLSKPIRNAFEKALTELKAA
ncbi:phasin [Mesorhizobium amorphae]|uniref:phasin n=1 Tax=Mesorhizobium amorphae TaxID=71433 RepID=UPI00235C0B8F|nr:phasin [Mesorhizobium amorphae]GLR46026.1 phasin [Mesorhizobium amorphae]